MNTLDRMIRPMLVEDAQRGIESLIALYEMENGEDMDLDNIPTSLDHLIEQVAFDLNVHLSVILGQDADGDTVILDEDGRHVSQEV